MAEMAPSLVTEYEEPVRVSSELEAKHDRPPKLTADEAAYLLERGPHVARLRAKERLLEIVLAYTIDPQTAPFMNSKQAELLSAEEADLATTLEEFDRSSSLETGSNILHFPDTEPDVDVTGNATTDGTVLVGNFGASTPSKPESFLKKRESAVCAETDPEVFFPEKGGSTRDAKKICNQICDLTDECLNYALDSGERFGIWGGLSERERRKLKRSR